MSLHDAQEDASGDDGASSSSEASSSKEPVAWTAKSGKKAAAWSDPSDAHITVSLAGDKRLRKLRDAPTEDDVNGKTYESKLRRKWVTHISLHTPFSAVGSSDAVAFLR